MAPTDFYFACDWVEENADQIDALPDLETFPFPWTQAYDDRGFTLNRFTPLDMAVIAGRRDIIEKLIAKGAQTDYLEDTMEYMRWKQEDVRDVLDLLPDQRPSFHSLSKAIGNHDARALEVLLDGGGDPNSQRAYLWNDDGTARRTDTLLEVAVRDGDLACAALLLQRGALIRPEAITLVVERRDDAAAMANLLLGAAKIMSVHTADAQDGTPLYWLVDSEGNDFPAKERYALAALLIEHGAEVNAAVNDGTTPMWVVCRGLYQSPEEDRLSLATMLIQHGAEVNVVSSGNGTTPLMFAGARGDLKVISLLLGAGADPLARDHEGRTALDFAWMRGRDKAAEVLLKAAGDPEREAI
ncbi:MAG: ankyrin repeat domain-containing protein [Armatimonadota bacterium]